MIFLLERKCGQLSTLPHLILIFICLHIKIKTFLMERLMHDNRNDEVDVMKTQYVDYRTYRSTNFHLVVFSKED